MFTLLLYFYFRVLISNGCIRWHYFQINAKTFRLYIGEGMQSYLIWLTEDSWLLVISKVCRQTSSWCIDSNILLGKNVSVLALLLRVVSNGYLCQRDFSNQYKKIHLRSCAEITCGCLAWCWRLRAIGFIPRFVDKQLSHISSRCLRCNILLCLIRPVFLFSGRWSLRLFSVFWRIPFPFFFSDFLNGASCAVSVFSARVHRIRIVPVLNEKLPWWMNQC